MLVDPVDNFEIHISIGHIEVENVWIVDILLILCGECIDNIHIIIFTKFSYERHLFTVVGGKNHVHTLHFVATEQIPYSSKRTLCIVGKYVDMLAGAVA